MTTNGLGALSAEEMIDQRILRQLECVLGLGELSWEISPFKDGLTNRNFRLKGGGKVVVLRLFGAEAKHLGIDRATEAAYSEAVSKCGIGPRILYHDAQMSLVEFVEGVQPSDQDAANEEVFAAVAESLHNLHALRPFGRPFVPAQYIRSYVSKGREFGVVDPEGFDEVWRVFERLERISVNPPARVPCHNDLNATNTILCPRAFLLDWEYAGLNCPYYDLGKYCAHHSLSIADADRLLLAYEPKANTQELHWFHEQLALAWMWQVAWLFVQSPKDRVQSEFCYYETLKVRMREFMEVMDETSALE